MKRQDVTQNAADLVNAVTGRQKARGGDWARSPELERLFKQATAKERKK
jgi:hypothetical protein